MTDSRDTRLAKARERAERRERIATAVLAGLMSDPEWEVSDSVRALMACDQADARLAELDRRRAAEEAQA